MDAMEIDISIPSNPAIEEIIPGLSVIEEVPGHPGWSTSVTVVQEIEHVTRISISTSISPSRRRTRSFSPSRIELIKKI